MMYSMILLKGKLSYLHISRCKIMLCHIEMRLFTVAFCFYSISLVYDRFPQKQRQRISASWGLYCQRLIWLLDCQVLQNILAINPHIFLERQHLQLQKMSMWTGDINCKPRFQLKCSCCNQFIYYLAMISALIATWRLVQK